jgi:hypothetical protein
LDLRQTLAEIDRRQAETLKFCDEQHKLAAEARKPSPVSYLTPVMVFASLIVSGGCLGTLIFSPPK